MKDHHSLEQIVADLGQFTPVAVYADAGYLVEIDLEDIYDAIEREEGTGAMRLRSVLARAISNANPIVANEKHLGRIHRISIIKAVRRG